MALLHPPNYLLCPRPPASAASKATSSPCSSSAGLCEVVNAAGRCSHLDLPSLPLSLSSSDIPSMAKVTAAAVAASSAAGPHLPPDRPTERPTNLGLAWLGSLRLPSGLLREITGLGPPTATAREGEAEGRKEWVFANTQGCSSLSRFSRSVLKRVIQLALPFGNG